MAEHGEAQPGTLNRGTTPSTKTMSLPLPAPELALPACGSQQATCLWGQQSVEHLNPHGYGQGREPWQGTQPSGPHPTVAMVLQAIQGH